MDFNAYAKINLSLDVTGILPNGYHNVSMVMQSVGLCDIVSVEKNTTNKITVTTDNSQIPDGVENLAYRACALMREKYDIPCGFDIKIKKNIPVAGGMAGGSTDAAAVMRGINELCGIGASVEELMEIGVTLGADVPFCIQQKPALAEGIGEKLTTIKGLSRNLYILLVNPNVLISTKEIYEKIDSKKCFNTVDNESLIAALKLGDLNTASSKMKNVMETVTKEICPSIDEIVKKLYDNGAKAALMSGSGATCYGVFESREKAIAAQNDFKGYFTALTNPVE